MNLGEAIMAQLAHIGVDTLFGIPGVHTAEMYRALPPLGIRHVTPRHEQGAAFMADGYARVSGQPGVCLLITGPGLSNAATPIAQAYSDSVPLLVISSVNPRSTWGKNSGRLHELPDQSGLASQICAFSATIDTAADIQPVFARALDLFTRRRPRPVHLQVPTDAVHQQVSKIVFADWPAGDATPVATETLREAADILASAGRPVVIAGGGSNRAAAVLTGLVERIDAPLFHTFRAKGVLADGHPLCGGAYLGATAVRSEVAAADVVLAVGTEFSPTDLYPHDDLPIDGRHIRIDIDPERSAVPATLDIEADAALALTALDTHLTRMGVSSSDRRGTAVVASLRSQLRADEPFAPWLLALRAAVPEDAIIVGDSTQLVYAANVSMPMYQPDSWLTSVTGYGTLGYALPAAIGAKLARPERPVVVLVGDGGLQFTLPELIVAVEHRLCLAVVVWHNSGYAEIRDFMVRHDVPPQGVDITTPHLAAIATAYGCSHCVVSRPQDLNAALAAAGGRPRPTLVEVTAPNVADAV